jgi:hypothetical protein
MQVVNFGGVGSSPVQKIFEFGAHSTKANCVAIGPLSGQVLATGGIVFLTVLLIFYTYVHVFFLSHTHFVFISNFLEYLKNKKVMTRR